MTINPISTEAARFLAAQPNQRCRHGLSIMEVLFAIGVLTVGLLGLASVLPVASNNAAETLQRDKAIEQVSNQVARELARIGDDIDSVMVANNSVRAFQPGGFWEGERYDAVSLDSPPANTGLGTPFNVSNPTMGLTTATAPSAFCIDPWFLTATTNLRPDTGASPDDQRNGYDRTLFPCYDPRFNPALSPSVAISNSADWLMPRFLRVSLPLTETITAPSYVASRHYSREEDGLSLLQPKDATRPPGLFVQKAGGTSVPARTTTSGHYSSMVMMSRSAPGSRLFNAAVVVMQDREVLIVPGAGADSFNLAPYTALTTDEENIPDAQKTYLEETVGYVTEAPRPFRNGGGGEFTFQHSAYMSPEVEPGDWLMLIRQEYARMTAPPPPLVPVKTHFSWYQVRSVTQEPSLSGGVYTTGVSVRGSDWVFHPSQVDFGNLLGHAPPYSPLYKPTSPSVAYDFSATGDQKYGTTVVLMPSVVSVDQFQTSL